jgi:hypothetical protein
MGQCRRHDLDRDVRPIVVALDDTAHRVALVGLGAPIRSLVLERPGAVAFERHAGDLGPRLEEAREARLIDFAGKPRISASRGISRRPSAV